MPAREELERMHLAELAELCDKVFKCAKATSLEADQSREMIAEWEEIRDQSGKEPEIADLKRRMVALLGVAANRLGIS